MPSADFCTAINTPFDGFSPAGRTTAQTSRGKFDRLHRTRAEFTTPVVDDCGLCDPLLARPAGQASLFGSCSSGRGFAPRFLQTLPRSNALALRQPFAAIRLGKGLSPPSCRTCSAHNKEAGVSAGLFVTIRLDVRPSPAARAMPAPSSRRHRSARPASACACGRRATFPASASPALRRTRSRSSACPRLRSPRP
jgi:hypothetical protein